MGKFCGCMLLPSYDAIHSSKQMILLKGSFKTCLIAIYFAPRYESARWQKNVYCFPVFCLKWLCDWGILLIWALIQGNEFVYPSKWLAHSKGRCYLFVLLSAPPFLLNCLHSYAVVDRGNNHLTAVGRIHSCTQIAVPEMSVHASLGAY